MPTPKEKRQTIVLLTDGGEKAIYYVPEKIDFDRFKQDLTTFRSNFRRRRASILVIRSKENLPILTISYSNIMLKNHLFRVTIYYSNGEQREILTFDQLSFQAACGEFLKILESILSSSQ